MEERERESEDRSERGESEFVYFLKRKLFCWVYFKLLGIEGMPKPVIRHHRESFNGEFRVNFQR